MEFDELKNPETQEKLKDAKTPEELLAIAKECGVELEDDQLTTVAGAHGAKITARISITVKTTVPLHRGKLLTRFLAVSQAWVRSCFFQGALP